MKGNETLVFDPGNQFSADVVPPYAIMPAYWRPFIFHVLKQRDFAVYMYVVSLCDKNDVAYPSVAHIQRDLNISSATTVATALSTLDDYGFLLRTRSPLPRRRSTAHQNVYQRPLPEYTLLTLLNLNLIDGDLLPTDWDARLERPSTQSRATHTALKKILDKDYAQYESLETSERTEFLKRRLPQIIFAKRAIGKLSHALSHGRLGKRTASRLKMAEDDLISGLQSTIVQFLPPEYGNDPFPKILFGNRVRSISESLDKALRRTDVNEVLGWLTDFEDESEKLETETISYVSHRADDRDAAEGMVRDLFAHYRDSVAALQERAADAKAGESTPF